jgi:hypothetical protein
MGGSLGRLEGAAHFLDTTNSRGTLWIDRSARFQLLCSIKTGPEKSKGVLGISSITVIHFNVQILEQLVLVTVDTAIFSPWGLTHNKFGNIRVLIYINSLSESLPTISATV